MGRYACGGSPPPGDLDWQLPANLTPGQLIIEGLRLNITVPGPEGDIVRALTWTGSLKAAVNETVDFNVTPWDPLAHRRVAMNASAWAY